MKVTVLYFLWDCIHFVHSKLNLKYLNETAPLERKVRIPVRVSYNDTDLDIDISEGIELETNYWFSDYRVECCFNDASCANNQRMNCKVDGLIVTCPLPNAADVTWTTESHTFGPDGIDCHQTANGFCPDEYPIQVTDEHVLLPLDERWCCHDPIPDPIVWRDCFKAPVDLRTNLGNSTGAQRYAQVAPPGWWMERDGSLVRCSFGDEQCKGGEFNKCATDLNWGHECSICKPTRKYCEEYTLKYGDKKLECSKKSEDRLGGAFQFRFPNCTECFGIPAIAVLFLLTCFGLVFIAMLVSRLQFGFFFTSYGTTPPEKSLVPPGYRLTLIRIALDCFSLVKDALKFSDLPNQIFVEQRQYLAFFRLELLKWIMLPCVLNQKSWNLVMMWVAIGTTIILPLAGGLISFMGQFITKFIYKPKEEIVIEETVSIYSKSTNPNSLGSAWTKSVISEGSSAEESAQGSSKSQDTPLSVGEKYRQNAINPVWITMGVLWYFCLTLFTDDSILPLDCIYRSDGIRVMRRDRSYICDDLPGYSVPVAAVFLLFNVLFIPVSFICYVYFYRGSELLRKDRSSMGFLLTSGLRPHFWWYSSFKLILRWLVLSLFIIITNFPKTHAARSKERGLTEDRITTIIGGVMFCVVGWIRPYDERGRGNLNYLEMASWIIFGAPSFCRLLLHPEQNVIMFLDSKEVDTTSVLYDAKLGDYDLNAYTLVHSVLVTILIMYNFFFSYCLFRGDHAEEYPIRRTNQPGFYDISKLNHSQKRHLSRSLGMGLERSIKYYRNQRSVPIGLISEYFIEEAMVSSSTDNIFDSGNVDESNSTSTLTTQNSFSTAATDTGSLVSVSTIKTGSSGLVSRSGAGSNVRRRRPGGNGGDKQAPGRDVLGAVYDFQSLLDIEDKRIRLGDYIRNRPNLEAEQLRKKMHEMRFGDIADHMLDFHFPNVDILDLESEGVASEFQQVCEELIANALGIEFEYVRFQEIINNHDLRFEVFAPEKSTFAQLRYDKFQEDFIDAVEDMDYLSRTRDQVQMLFLGKMDEYEREYEIERGTGKRSRKIKKTITF